MPSEFEKRVQQILRDILRHEGSSIREAQALLRRLHTEVIAEIAKGGSEFTLMVLRQLSRAIELRIEAFDRDIQAAFKRQLNRGIELGTEMADAPLKTTGAAIKTFGISGQTAQVAAQYQVGLISGLGLELQSKINSILRRAALGALTPNDAIKQVGRKVTAGPFKSALARAETIVRTEVLRIQSIATHARLLEQRESLKRAGYTLKKRWLSSHDTRVRATHRAAELEGPIELEDLFVVGADQLLYPRDPNGSAEETVNCRCVEAPVVEKAA